MRDHSRFGAGSTPRQIWLDVLGQFPVYELQYHSSAVRFFKIEK